MAGSEPDVAVSAQLACTARRLDPGPGLDVAHRLLLRDQDGDDPHLPLLLWWAVEQHAIAGREHALALFTAPEAWRSGMIRSTIQGRLLRRYALEAGPAGEEACARLLASAPTAEARRPLLAALDEAMRGRGTVDGRAGPGPDHQRRRPARRDADPAVGPVREPHGDRAGPRDRRRPPGARAGPPGDARPAGRPRGSGGPRAAARPGRRARIPAPPRSDPPRSAPSRGSRTSRSPRPCWPPTRGRTRPGSRGPASCSWAEPRGPGPTSPRSTAAACRPGR